jgi:CopG family nickel-responsive transcriptional regulator
MRYSHRKEGSAMQRVTITIEDELLAEVDALVVRHGYQNRSEAMRDLARAGMRQLVYDHERRDLPNRLAHEFHDHHDLAVSTLHVHLDAKSCLEVAVLKGAARAVRHMADHVTAERGVRHGQLVLLPSSAPKEARKSAGH